MTWAAFKKQLASVTGDREDASGTYEGYYNRLGRKVLHYMFPGKTGGSGGYGAQTISLSASQPLTNRVVHMAQGPECVEAIYFFPFTSATVTATETMAYHIVVNKLGGGAGTVSGTYSVTAFIGGLSSGTDKHATASKSFSTLGSNLANAPNKFLLGSASDRALTRGDVLVVRVDKGSGTATDSGAVFRGGSIHITLDEDDV